MNPFRGDKNERHNDFRDEGRRQRLLHQNCSEHDVYTFAGLSGDFNPAHVNEVEAQKGMFGKRIAHGMLSAGFISTVLGTQLPGPGTIYMGQGFASRSPCSFGDTITATATVVELIPEKNRAKLETVCNNQNGEVVITALATVMPPKD